VAATCRFLAARVLQSTGHLSAAEERLAPVLAAGPSRIQPFAEVWMGFLRLHQGRHQDALRHLAVADLARRGPAPHAGIYVDQVRAHALQLAGRPLEALAAVQRMDRAVAEEHADRFAGRALVYRAWILRTLGAPEAGEVLEQARELARAAGNPEPYGQGTLDLAMLRLDGGDLNGAAALLAEAAALTADGRVSNGWRIDIRRRWLEGRLALAAGDRGAARQAAADVLARSERDGLRRYRVLAALLDAQARHRTGAAPAEALLAAVHALAEVARPEAWQLTARLARDVGSAELRRLAERRVEAVAATAGPYAAQVRAAARRLLG